MLRLMTLAAVSMLLAAAPGWAASFQIFESSLGGPGVTAQFPYGTGQVADLDFDASSAEGGGLQFGGPGEIEIVPLGDLIFVAFSCQLSGCTEGTDYLFTPGGEGTGHLILTDPNPNAQTGIVDMGLMTFDIASGLGTMELLGCNYTGGDAVERQCDPFTLVQVVPEPGTVGLLALGLVGLGLYRRR